MADCRFVVRLTARAGADRIDAVADDGALLARVAAPPVNGAANRALMRLLARELDVAPSRVQIAAGTSARRKTITVAGLGPEAILARWPGLRL